MATKKLSFSYSKMGMYKECPQKYKFRYIHMLPEQPKYYFAFGSALHEVMEYVYTPKNPAFPTLEQTLSFFETHWNSTSFEQKGYASMAKEQDGYQEGRRIIESYYEKHGSEFFHPLSVEMRSTLDLDNLNLISILDRIDYLGDGKVKILDYKTGKTVKREPDQLYMYQKVVENSPAIKSLVQQSDPAVKEIKVQTLSFYHLPSLKEMTFERAPDDEIAEFWKGVLKVADNIREGLFSPAPEETRCRFCDYRNLCPVFTGKEYDGPSGWGAKQSFAQSVPKTVQQPKTQEPVKNEQEILSDKIDRYGQITAEAVQLKQEIVRLMKTNKFSRHFGKEYIAELLKTEKIEFTDRQKVVDTLKQLNLLKKVLVPTQSTIEGLLEDASVPADQKAKIKALSKTTAQTDLEIKKTE